MSDIASLIELDLPTAPTLPRTVAAPTVPDLSAQAAIARADEAQSTAVPLSTWTHQVSAGQQCADLIEAERAVLGAAGISTSDKDLSYAAGTALAVEGHEALAHYDRAFKALPDPQGERDRFGALIDAERRADHSRDLAGMRLNVAGRLAATEMIADGATGLQVGEVAWKQLREVAGGQNINAGLSARKTAPRKLRTRSTGVGSGRQVFGIVTDKYQVLDGPQVADLVLSGMRSRGLLSGAKMEIKYDADTTRWDVRAIVQAPVDVPAFAGVGRVHQLFARVTGGDDGMTALRGGIGAIRIRCLNATLCESRGATWRRNHIGAAYEVRSLVASMVDAFGDAGESLKRVWSDAAAHHYLDTDGRELSVQEALSRLVAHGHIPTGGHDPEVAVDHFLAAWRAEDSPTSAAGVLMAVQRAAHESTWRTSWAQPEMEEAASKLLYQPVWQLDEVEA